MVSSQWLYLGFIGVLGLERLVELVISRKNAAWAFSRGGREYGARHFPYMKLLHTLFLLGCVAEVLLCHRVFHAWLGFPMLALALAAQGLRYWVIATLGHQWNVRVIVVPGAPRVTSGPYRFLRHPNYLGVAVEGLAIPLIHSAWITALAFSLLNALVLAVRIPCEERALAG